MVGTRALVGVCALAVAAAACDGGGGTAPPGPATLDAVRAATADGATATVEGTRTRGGREDEVRGTYAAEPPAARVGYPVAAGDGAVVRLEARVVGGSVYLERAEADDATLTDPRLVAGDRVFLRRAGEPTWLRRPARALALVHPAIVGPFELLDLLRAAGAGLGDGRPDGARRRHDLDAAALRPLGASAATLWVGPDRRLARVRVEAAGGTVDYEVTGYGAPLEVSAPARRDVTDTGTAGGTAPAPAGPWVRVANGRHEGVPWALERAPAAGGGDCWRFTSSPRLAGSEVACIPVPPPSTPPPLAVDFPFTTGGEGPADVVVAVTAVEVTDARFLRLDGTALGAVASVAADGRGAIVWVGATRPPVVAASLTTAAGGVLSCGPGAVASVADAQGLTPAELDDARGYPWACTG